MPRFDTHISFHLQTETLLLENAPGSMNAVVSGPYGGS